MNVLFFSYFFFSMYVQFLMHDYAKIMQKLSMYNMMQIFVATTGHVVFGHRA